MSKFKNGMITLLGTVVALLIHRMSIALLTVITAGIHKLPYPAGISIQVSVSCIPQIFLTPNSFAYIISIIIWALIYGVSAFLTHLFIKFLGDKTTCSPKTIRIALLFLVGIAAFGSVTVPTEEISVIGYMLGAAVFIPSYVFLRNHQ